MYSTLACMLALAVEGQEMSKCCNTPLLIQHCYCVPVTMKWISSVCVCLASLDGGIGYILPLPEKTYRRFSMLQSKLVTGLPHAAGLNPKGFR